MTEKNNPFIFCIALGCAPIANVMLKSFYKYHKDRFINIICRPKDVEQLKLDFEINYMLHVISDRDANNYDIDNRFKMGHSGTAIIFAMVLNKFFGDHKKIIHIDTDLIFRKESISLIERYFDEGYDLIGSRRCYGNNPSGIKGLEKYPDTISTYFLGIKTDKLSEYPTNYLSDMCQGGIHPLGFTVLDFFDPVTHCMISNGAILKYIDNNLIGGQNEQGKKISKYASNMHMDFGENLIHFGGVGSGYSVYHNNSSPQKSYADWAVGKYAFFAKRFLDIDIGYNKPTEITSDGRWCDGMPNGEILANFENDLLNG